MESIRSVETEKAFEKEAEEDGLKVLCWRTVPTDSTFLGNVARATEPFMRQVQIQYNGLFIFSQVKQLKLNTMNPVVDLLASKLRPINLMLAFVLLYRMVSTYLY